MKLGIKLAFPLQPQPTASENYSVSLQSILDSLTLGVILLSSKGHVTTMNPAAKRIVAGNGGLFVDRFGLRAEQAAESKQLEQLIASATAVSTIADVESAGCVTISRKDSSPLQVVVSRLRGLDIDETHPIRAIVFICDTTTHTRPTRETLMAHFGLTPAEYRVAILLADGHGPNIIAQMLGVTRNTLKSQLSSIFRKTNTSRQAQLVRLLLQLSAPKPSPEN
jgi:DNA-binding CsgD family transcriptional regulator